MDKKGKCPRCGCTKGSSKCCSKSRGGKKGAY